MKTEDLIKWGAVAIGAWWLINALQEGGALYGLISGGTGAGAGTGTQVGGNAYQEPAGQITAPGGTQTTDQSVSNQPQSPVYEPPAQTAPPPTVSAPGAVQAMIAAAGTSTGLTFDQWNYFYNQVTGNAGPAPEDVGVTRTNPMPQISASQWASAVQGRIDLSGLRGMGRLYSVLSSGVPRGGWAQ